MTRTIERRLPPPTPPRGEDLPYDDGMPMETERHKLQMDVLDLSLREAWAHRDDVAIHANMFVYFSELQAKKNDFLGPDVFVVVGAPRRERKSWVVWEEDGRLPHVVIELTSETTEANDRGHKKDVYARVMRVPCYVIYDPFSARLDVFRLDLDLGEYVAEVPDEDGFYACAPLDLRLGVVQSTMWSVEAPWLRWIDRSGRPLPLSSERLESEKARADYALLCAENERLRAEDERGRADAASARADAAEAELAKLRAELARR